MRTFWNVIRGVGSVIDIWPAPRLHQIVSPTHGRSDADALRGDWERIGGDFQAAIGRVKAEAAPDGKSQQTS